MGTQTEAPNGRMALIQAMALVLVIIALSGVFVLCIAPPPGADLEYWAPWSIGLAAVLISGVVWAVRPGELATRLFFLGGIAFMISLMVSAALGPHMGEPSPEAGRIGLIINLVANQFFNLSLVGLFLHYPKPLLSPRWIWAILALTLPFGIIIAAMDTETILAVGYVQQTQLLAVIGLIVWQWIATRGHPRDRAALTWLALSVAVGSALWVILLIGGHMMGNPGATGGAVALILFFPFYLGLALGVARFCLIELQDWTFRILFFLMAALLFVAIDAALVILLGLGGNPALGISLFVVAFAYLPLRDLIWRRFAHGKTLSQSDMFAAVMEIVFAPSPADRAARWRGLVRGLFSPLDMEPTDEVEEAAITEGGLRLVLPAAADGPPLVLSYAREGRGLFARPQLALAQRLVTLVRTASMSRNAYERGAAEERRRLAQDLHDDVGARLLSGLTVADDRTRPIFHDALGDIRAIANGLAGTEAPLDRVLADLRHECIGRLEAAGLETDWPVWSEEAPLLLVDYRLQKALGSSLREAVSNIIRHAGAKTVTIGVRLADGRLIVTVRDDGKGLGAEALNGGATGLGLKGLTRRLGDIGGQARMSNRADASTGAQVELDLPLRV